ncbi:MAG: transporter [Hyphomicrobiales bacterium]|nr:transporter [Hyphomicrobiales bacterium]
MSSGLIALLDDVAGLAKIAAASLDDVAGQAAKAGAKAAGAVIDDAAVTPRYVMGFAARRELPIIGKIALGSIKNKLFYLLPAALLLDLAAPWAVTPLLMLGGAYLCFEGAEKILEALRPHADSPGAPAPLAASGEALEREKVNGAIRTDLILSAEIMAITLATVTESTVLTQALVLAAVGLGITVAVYGAVALIVKADDFGVVLARTEGGGWNALVRGAGRALVKGMPVFLSALGWIGTVAMVWVGGGILLHGLEGYGASGLAHAIEAAAEAAGRSPGGAAAGWLVESGAALLAGLAAGLALAPLVHYVIAPLLRRAKG